ncbi:MAG: hypothetical protein ACM3UZ_05690 [Acidobacteriota bacterium]
MEQRFSISAAVDFGRQKYKENFGYWMKVYGILLAIFIVYVVIGLPFDEHNPITKLIDLIYQLINIYLTMGLIKIAVGTIDDNRPPVSALFTSRSRFWSYFGASLMINISAGFLALVAIIPIMLWSDLWFAFILLLIPSAYILIRWAFFGYLVVDKEMNASAAMGMSWDITEGCVLQIIGFGITMVGIILLGTLALGIGLFVALPVTELATAHAYRQLVAAHMPVDPDPLALQETAAASPDIAYTHEPDDPLAGES